MPIKFTATQTQALRLLGQYKFLTTSQMLKLDVSTKKQNLSKQVLRPLLDIKCIGSEDFAVTESVR